MVLINQLRTNIKLAKTSPYANPMKSTGGKAVEYFPSFKVTLQAKAPTKNKRYFDDLGIKLAEPIKCIIGKNKLARTVDFGLPSTLRLGFGFDPIYDLIDLSELAYQIRYSGAWICIGDESVAQGIANFYNILVEEKEVRDKLVDKTLPLVGINDTEMYKKLIDDYIERKSRLYDSGLIHFAVEAKEPKTKKKKKK